MNAVSLDQWQSANQRYLMAAIAVIRQRLEQHTGSLAEMAEPALKSILNPQEAMQEAASQLSGPSALEMVCAAFDLSPFERDLLLLCAGMELSAAFAPLCAKTQGNDNRPYPTFSLALDALPDPHWTALTPDAPLQHWRLIVETSAGFAFTQNPLRIDRRILNYLVGVQHLDERLMGLVEPLPTTTSLVPSHQEIANQIARLWLPASQIALPVIQLCEGDRLSKRAIAAAACRSLNLNLNLLSADLVPPASELEGFIRLWEREAILGANALLLDCETVDQTDCKHHSTLTHLIDRIRSPLLISTRERRLSLRNSAIHFDVHAPTLQEQRQVWDYALGDLSPQLNGHVETLLYQFNLSAPTIQSICAEVIGRIKSTEIVENEDKTINHPDSHLTVLWNTCRKQARPRLDDLAQRIDTVATQNDLILPELQQQTLRDIAAHVRQRSRVYETWGFKARGNRGLGISALFAGESGTGKTLAAEVLAHELQLDLYRIDLSQVVSKYIGETEKNLRQVFDAAEEGGVVLLFDEADALFGKRSEVKDSHDRYANIEVSYLLQRMEAYRGLAILTTNLKNALDPAFLRRIRFVVQFPFPDIAQRQQIWQRIFPTDTPTEGLDMQQLARLNVTGGNIRNIALNAAFLAADQNESISMKHLLYAARSEYTKLEKPLTDVEVGRWV